MITDLPEGTLFQYRYRGQLVLGKVVTVNGVKCNQVFGSLPPGGTVVHRGVWKDGDRLESRGTFIWKTPHR